MVEHRPTMNILTNGFHTIKVVIVGDVSVGKTSLAVRLTDDHFKEKCESTITSSFNTKLLETNGEHIKFNIWDTAGQERYRSLIPMYLRGAAIAIIVYDITNKKSFDNMHYWIDLINGSTSEDIKCALVGNKKDLLQYREVDKEAATYFAKQRQIYFNEVSAKSGENVGRILCDMAKSLSKTSKRKSLDTRSSFKLNSDNIHHKHHGCCNE